uniref:reticulon-1-like isoform X1 n=2 Tax=Myxine glutinosa TaxID=7769 RepID=UPI0035901729
MEGDPDKVWEPQSGHHIGSSAHQMTPQQIIGTSSSEEEDEEPDIYTAAPVESQKAEAKYPDHPTVPTRQLPYVVDSDSDTEEVYGSTMLEHIPPDLLEEMNKMAKGIQRSSEGSPLKAVDEKCEMEERGSGKKEFEKEMDVSKKQEEDDETDDEDEEVKERDEQLLEIIKMAKDPPGRLPSPHVQGADEMYEPEIQWADVSSTEWAQPGLVERTFLQPTAPQMPDRVEVEGQEDFEDVTSSAKEEPKMPKYDKPSNSASLAPRNETQSAPAGHRSGGSDSSSCSDESASSDGSAGSVVRAGVWQDVDSVAAMSVPRGMHEELDDDEEEGEVQEEKESNVGRDVEMHSPDSEPFLVVCRAGEKAANGDESPELSDSPKSEPLSPGIEIPERSEFGPFSVPTRDPLAGSHAGPETDDWKSQDDVEPVMEAPSDVCLALEEALQEDKGGRDGFMETEGLADPGAIARRDQRPRDEQTPSSTNVAVEDLLYWRDPRRSGAVFAGLLSLLLALTQYSVVSVFSYLALAMLALTITYRIYKAILKSIQKSDSGHPFKAYLDKDISVTQEGAKRITDAALPYVNHTTCSLQRLILVQDLVDSLKLAVCAWLTTYVGAIFNGLTLIILAVICLFSVPVIYEKYQAQIDQYVGLVRKQFDDVMAK